MLVGAGVRLREAEKAIYNETQTWKKEDSLYPLTISIDQAKCGNYRILQLMS